MSREARGHVIISLMPELLREILSSGIVTDADGEKLAVHSNTSAEQRAFIQDLISRTGARHCLEVGLAYGVSSLAICEAISSHGDARLISIDPFQQAHWKGIGLLNLERGGFSSIVDFHECFSYEVLPKLLSEGTELDFAYVDTTKIFDAVLVDAFYITRLLRQGGVVVFDDCSWPGIRKLVRYIASWPHMEVFATHDADPPRLQRRLASSLGKALPLRKRILRPELVRTDRELGVGAGCVAFRKLGNDNRPWDWSLLP